MILDSETLCAWDLLCSGLLFAGFVAAFLADKKGEIRIWQLADAAFNGIYGFCAFFFPAVLLGMETVGELDVYHQYLYQCVGGSFVALSVITLQQVQSEDRRVSGGWLFSRVVGCTFMLMSDMYTLKTGGTGSQRFTDKHLLFGGLGFGMMFLGSLIKLWQHHSVDSGVSSSSKVRSASVLNQHLLLSIVISLPEVVLNYGMPQFSMEFFMTSKYDVIHLHCVRAIGVASLMLVLQEMAALEYENDSDKRDFFIGRIVLYLLLFPMVCLYHFKHSINSTNAMITCLVGVVFQLGNCGCAAFLRLREKEH